MGSLGSNFHAGPGSLTESGGRVRIRDRRGRPVRAFPAGWEGPVFFPGHVAFLWTVFEQMVQPQRISVALHDFYHRPSEKQPGHGFSEDEFLRNEFYKDIEYDEWFLERIHACFIQNPL